MSGICDTCRRNQCRLRADGLKMCDLHEGCETRWRSLFGTPERAARTLIGICDECTESACSRCKLDPLVGYATDYDALLELLKGDAE